MFSTIGVCILANVLIILSSIFSFGCINSALPLPALANCFIKYEFTFESIPNGNILQNLLFVFRFQLDRL